MRKTNDKTDVQTRKSARHDQSTSASRRRFLTNTGMFSAGLVGSTLLAACNDSDDNAAIAGNNNGGNGNNVHVGGPPDEAILNFALNLEYLEAEYYVQAVTGNGLQSQDIGDDPGMVITPGSTQVDFTGHKLLGEYAAEIAADELHHVQFLRKALGKHAIDRPKLDLKNSFMALGNLIGAPNFDPFSSPMNFLIGAFIFEDVGVTAYHGGSAFIKNRTYLDAAAGILSVEAYHAGLIRTFMTSADYQNGNTAYTDIANKISDVRDSVDGTKDKKADYDAGRPPIAADDDQGISRADVDIYGSQYAATNIVPTNDLGVAYDRSIPQVHNVVYATAEQKSSGGFFPNGTTIPGFENLTKSADNT